MEQAHGHEQGGEQLGVAIVAYRSADIIADCLTSLAASHDARLRIVVLDNASDDATVERIREWAAAQPEGYTFAEGAVGEIACARADLTLLRSAVNGGFAYGTNRCLEVLLADPALQLFWLVNPDARARPDTARHYLDAGADGAFALMGGRTVFAGQPQIVQTDGGRVSLWTGKCTSVNWGRPAAQAQVPAAATLDYITGANCVASRRFIDHAGLMREEYFLYYEEVDWALRRGDLPLRVVPQAVVEHLGGTAIGSAGIGRGPSAFSAYFSFRNRIRFLRRFNPWAVPLGLGSVVLKALHWLAQRAPGAAGAALAGALGLAPPASVRAILSPEALARALAPPAR